MTELIQRLKDPDPNNREEAALILGIIGTEQEAEALLNSLDNELIPEVKQMIIHALGKTNSQKNIQALVNCLEEQDFEIRWVTVEALGEIGSQEVISPLIACLEKEPVWNVRAAIAKVLGKLGSEKAIMALVKCLNDSDFYVRKEATNALKNLSQAFWEKSEISSVEAKNEPPNEISNINLYVESFLKSTSFQELRNKLEQTFQLDYSVEMLAQLERIRREEFPEDWGQLAMEVLTEQTGLTSTSIRHFREGDESNEELLNDELYNLVCDLMEALENYSQEDI